MSTESPNVQVFGSLATDIADTWLASIQEHWQAGVVNLPMMSASKQEQLTNKLVNETYAKYADVIECYSKRNVCSIEHMFPRYQQVAIRDYVLNDKEEYDDEKEKEDSDAMSSHVIPDSLSISKIPTEKDMQDLQAEIERMQIRLADLMETKEQVMRSKKIVEYAQQVASEAKETTVSSSSSDNIAEKMQKTAQVSRNLQLLQQDAKQAQEQLDEIKRQRDNSSNSDGEDDEYHVSIFAPVPKKTKPLSLEEKFSRDCQRLPLQGIKNFQSTWKHSAVSTQV